MGYLQGPTTSVTDVEQHELRFTFSYYGDKEKSASTSIAPWNEFSQLSLSSFSDWSSFISDDIED